MKHKSFLLICLTVLILLTATGCSKYSDIQAELDEITIENILPDLPKTKMKKLADTDEAIYEQQLAVCRMLSDAYNDTYYLNFVNDNKRYNKDKLSQICNDKRIEIDQEIANNFVLNIYHIISEVKDCQNQDAFIEKTYEDVLNFYDYYDKYLTSRNKNQVLCDILTNYSERNNLLALNFLTKNEQKVYNAATTIIEQNAESEKTDDYSYRYYINKNNRIVNALNFVFDGVPKQYAARISKANTLLAEKLMDSLDSISDSEKEKLMSMLTGTSSPKPSEKPEPSDEPETIPTPNIAATPKPKTTLAPVTAAPKATAPPVFNSGGSTAAQTAPNAVAPVAPQPTAVPAAPQPTAAPAASSQNEEYNFSSEDDNNTSESYYFD